MIVFWSLKIIDQSMTMNISSTFYFVFYHVVNLLTFFNYFLIKFSMINCFDDDNDLLNKSFFSTQRINRWQQIFRNSFRSREEKFEIVMTETNWRIARKVCKQKSIYIFFEKWKMIKSKTTFSNECKSDFNINSCDEWFFWLFFFLIIFKKKIKLSATTSSAI